MSSSPHLSDTSNSGLFPEEWTDVVSLLNVCALFANHSFACLTAFFTYFSDPMTNTYVLVHLEMYTYQLAFPNMWWDVQWNLSLPERAD